MVGHTGNQKSFFIIAMMMIVFSFSQIVTPAYANNNDSNKGGKGKAFGQAQKAGKFNGKALGNVKFKTSTINSVLNVTLDQVKQSARWAKITACVLVNQGDLAAFVAPYAAQVSELNIQVEDVVINGGDEVVVDLKGDQLISLAVSEENQESVQQVKRISVHAAKTIVDAVVNMDGVEKAETFQVSSAGTIALSAAQEVVEYNYRDRSVTLNHQDKDEDEFEVFGDFVQLTQEVARY